MTGFPFSNAVVSALVHATEDEQRVMKALRFLIPETIGLRRSNVKGHFGNPITMLEARLRKGEIRELCKNILSNLGMDELERLRESVPRKLDQRCNLYLRFDKQKAHEGELELIESGDAIHIRLKVSAFPPKGELATKLVLDFLGGFGDDREAKT